MKNTYLFRENGQSLIIFVLISLALMAFLAFVIDGSNVYTMRRLAQNAADAGALAGARQLCITGDDGIAIASAEDYGDTKNLALISNVIDQSATATVITSTVKVDVSINYNSFFAQILGIDDLNAVASARAGCFPPGGAEGESVVPIAWRCPNFITVDIGGMTYLKCDLQENREGDTTCTLGDDPVDNDDDLIYVFFDFDLDQNGLPKQNQPLYWCNQWGAPPAPPSGAVITTINCDLDTDDDPDADIWPITPLNPQNKWYWVNTNGGPCGASEEVTIIREGLTSPMQSHTWYPGCEGNMTTVYGNIANYRLNEQVVIPVFDLNCRTDDPEFGVCGWHPNDEKVLPSGGSAQQEFFHLSSFAIFKLSCVDSQGNHCNNPSIHGRAALDDLIKDQYGNNNGISPSQNSIEGCFINGFVSGMSGDPGGVITGAWVIYLLP